MREASMLFISENQVALEAAKKGGILSTIGALTIQLGVQMGLLSASLATNAALTFGVGVAIAVAAAAAGYYAIKAMTADDMVSQGNAPAGYGKRTLLGPEGAIALNDKDTVLAGTNLFPKDNNSKEGTNTIIQQDNTESKRTNQLLESSVQALNELTKLSSRPSVFKIGTDEFFTSTSKYSYQVQ